MFNLLKEPISKTYVVLIKELRELCKIQEEIFDLKFKQFSDIIQEMYAHLDSQFKTKKESISLYPFKVDVYANSLLKKFKVRKNLEFITKDICLKVSEIWLKKTWFS